MNQCSKCSIRKTHQTCKNLCRRCFNEQKGRFCRECNKPVYSIEQMLCQACYNRYIKMDPRKLRCHNILGWECVCCKRNDINILEMDHINGIKGKQVPVKQMYDEIILMGIKAHKKYQILCHVCNNSKSQYDKCTLNHKYDLNNLHKAIDHMKELGINLDDIKIPKRLLYIR